jgi:hypothetical protein
MKRKMNELKRLIVIPLFLSWGKKKLHVTEEVSSNNQWRNENEQHMFIVAASEVLLMP